MKHSLIALSIAFLTTAAKAAVEYHDIKTSDGTVIQTCAQFPDSTQFPGARPAIMINWGSGLYDYCRDRTFQSPAAKALVARGVIVFSNLKRGIRHNPKDNTFTTDLTVARSADISHIKSDALEAFNFYTRDQRINSKKMAAWGGSEGTIVSTFIALHHPDLAELDLSSTMIEDFPTLYARQMYEILPQLLLQMFDKESKGELTKDELTDSFLISGGLDSFDVIDTNHDEVVTEQELSADIKRVISHSLKNGNDTFFLSDLGGKVTANWVNSMLKQNPLAPQILSLKMQVYMQHGTADQSTSIQPVYELQNEVLQQHKSNFHFHYYQGLDHELSADVIWSIITSIGDRLLK